MTTEARRHLSLLRSYAVAAPVTTSIVIVFLLGVSGSAMISATLRVPKP